MIFLSVIGSLALFSVLGFFMGFKREQKDRRTVLYVAINLVVGGLFGLLVFSIAQSHWISVENGYTLMQILLLLWGIFHVWWLYEHLFWSRRHSFLWEQDSFFMESVFTFLVVLVLSAGLLGVLLYLRKDMVELFWSVGLVFLVPFLFLKTYDFLLQIPNKDYRVKWVFTTQPIRENDWVWQNEMWVHFTMKESWRKPGARRMASFRILVPRQASLGETFRLGIREHNRRGPEIVVQDLGFEPENAGQFWWLFSLKFMWSRPHTWFPNIRLFDPSEPVFANGLRPGDIVLAQRVAFKEGYLGENEEVAVGII